MKHMLRLAALVALFAFALPPGKEIKIYLVGDSTMCEYDARRSPLAGWGMPFRFFFDSSVVIDNRARGGRSTRTFVSEGRWQPIAENLNAGDYVFIQFGHNDEAKEERYKDRYTPVPDYKDYLVKFISETRAKNATPVLITPVSRLRFKDGRAQETHEEYTNAVYEVGKAHNVPVIDLDKMSRELYQQLGEQDAKLLFMQLAPGEHPAYPGGQNDNTHFNDYGARKIASLVLKGIRELNLGLVEHLAMPKNPPPSMEGVTNVPDTSYTNYSAYLGSKKANPGIELVELKRTPAVRMQTGVSYCDDGLRNLVLDIFQPAKKSRKARPAIMIVHGGGWRSGNRAQHHALAEALALRGYVCFTPEYRLSTEALYPAAIFDLKNALRWIRVHGKDYQVDTNKIAVMGFSAGGELAAFLGTTANNPLFEKNNCQLKASTSVNAIVDLDGTLSFVHPESGEGDDSKRTSAATYWFGYSKKDHPALWTEASPLTYVSSKTPPTLFINSSVDRMHAGRDDYRKALATWNIYTEVKTFADAPHSFPQFEPWFTPTVNYTDEFLKKVFQ